jgi:crotonobetainyl-CoA:carnitine CoA-transferase CaiB-like acyl-CoA transferase
MFNKLQNNTTVEIINKPFLNLVYFHLTFFKNFIKTMANELDKGESIFSRDVYNYVKTKDGKYISMGNLENKFQENMKNVIDGLSSTNQYGKSSNGGSNNKDEFRMIYEEEDVKRNSYDFEGIANVFSEHNRDELWVKVRK